MKKSLPILGRAWHLLLVSFSLLFLAPPLAFGQSRSGVEGIVRDGSTGEPLIGVLVTEKGTSNVRTTSVGGKFQITASEGATLVFSSLGYTTLERTIAGAGSLDISLQPDTKMLDQVVVVGYGTQKKVNLTGAVTAIDGAAISHKSSSDVLSALQGEMPGVAILRSSGEPGSETSGMRIRGFSSINAADPLVLIDGVQGDMTLLNPGDVASISVLKDAGSSAIYGARAAAGVVLITTKTSTGGKVRVSYNGYFGVNTPTHMPKRLPAWEEQQFINESRIQAGGTPEWNAELSSWVANPNFNYRPNNGNGRWDFFEATNWVDEGTRKFTTQQNHSVSVSGGNKDINYLVSGNFFTKNGILKFGPDKNERYNLRVKFNANLNKYFDIAVNANYNGKFIKANPYGAKGILERLYRVRGRQPILNPESDIAYEENPYNGDLQQNAIHIMKDGGVNDNSYQSYMGKGELGIKNLVKGLRFKFSASRQAGYYSAKITRPYLMWADRKGNKRFDVNSPNSLEKTKNNDFSDNFEALGYYDLAARKHSFSIMAGATYENYRKDEIKGTARNMNSNSFFTFNAYDTSVAANTSLTDLVESWAVMSYIGRINYNFAERYLFEANIRYDGASRLAPSLRWAAFPSFSAGWRVSEEPWFKVRAIDNLKVRASWGQLGNPTLGLYDYLPELEAGDILGEKYYYQKIMASKNKTWERLETTNVGFDLDMFSGRLSLTADYYWKSNKGMLIDHFLPGLAGIVPAKGNIGHLKTWGWEFQISWRDKIGDLSYRASFNLSDSQNKLVALNGTNLVKAGTVPYLEGYPLNTIWGYRTNGYWSSREEYLEYKAAHPGYQSFNDGKVSGGDVRYLAAGEADHTIGIGKGTPEDPGDLVMLGDTSGRYLFGFSVGLEWKGIDFSMMWQGVAKRNILIDTNTIAPFQATSNMPWTIHRDYWTPENQNARWPRLYNQNTFNYNPSDKWVQDASYIRLKNIQIGYTFPIKKSIIERLRVYVSGDDVWEYSKLLDVYDPEVGNDPPSDSWKKLEDRNKIDARYYPFFRTWSIGLNITF